MSSNRPLFDDEDLPAWLKNAGITYAGRARRSAPPPREGGTAAGEPAPAWSPFDDLPPPAAGDVPWSSEVSMTELAAEPAVPTGDMPWSSELMLDELPPAAPDTDVPWTTDTPSPAPGADLMPWEQAAPETAGEVPDFLASDLMPWEAGSPEDPFAEVAETGAADDDWLTAFAPGGDAAAQTGDPFADVPEPGGADDDWLTAFAPESDATAQTEPQSPEADLGQPEVEQPTFDWPSAEGTEASTEAVGSALDEMHNWLSDEAPSEPPQAAESPLEPGADIPDWFEGFAPGEPEAASPPAELAGVDAIETPEWFTAADEAAPGGEPVPDWAVDLGAEPTPAEESEAPVWLEDLHLPRTPAAAPAETPVPEWPSAPDLDRVGASPPVEEAAEPEALADADMPEWMRDLAPVEAPPIAEETDLAPEWLENVDFGEAAVQPPAEPAPAPARLEPAAKATPPASDELDLNFDLSSADIDTLLNLPVESALVPTEQAEPEIQAVDLDEMLDLDALLGPADAAYAADEVSSGEAALPELRFDQPTAPLPLDTGASGQILPEWVAEMRPADAPVTLRIGDQQVRLEQTPFAQLDDQYQQFRERVRKGLAMPPDREATPSSGPLTGIVGAIEPAESLLRPGRLEAATGVIVDDVQARRLRLLENILGIQDDILQKRMAELEEAPAVAGEPGATPIPSGPRIRARLKLDRILITFLLALAIAAPFFTDLFNLVTTPNLTALSPAQQSRFEEVFSAVDALQAGQPVLVAFEYGPTAAGELDDLARALLRDLIRRGAVPVLVSTNPSGALHAQGLIARLGNDAAEQVVLGRQTALVARSDYVALGYLPGGLAGVRALVNALQTSGFQRQVIFTTDIEGKPSGLGDDAVDVLKTTPAFVLTEAQEDVRNWVEQYRATAPQAEGLFRLVLLSSAQAGAVARVYALENGEQRILGPLVSLHDAIIYQENRGQFTTALARQRADQRWQSIGLTTLLAAVLILTGTALNLIRSLRRRRSSRR